MAGDAERRLRAQRAAAAAELAARVADDQVPLPALRDLQERVRLIDAVLADQRARDERRPLAVLGPLAVVAVALTAVAVLPVPSVPVSLDLQASAVALTLPEASALAGQPAGGLLRVEGYTAFDAGDAELSAAAGRDTQHMAVRADRVLLRGLQLPAGTRLTVQAEDGGTTLIAESPVPALVVDAEVQGRTRLSVGDADLPPRAIERGEWLRWTGGVAGGAQAPPPLAVSLARDAAAPLRLGGLRPASLRFVERRAGAGAGSVVGSSLEGGSVNLPATGQTLAITAGDGLTVERCELTAEAPLRLKLSGSARAVRLRVGEYERSLKPSVLEYVSRHHLVTLLWGSGVALWGALAWMRRQFGGLRR